MEATSRSDQANPLAVSVTDATVAVAVVSLWLYFVAACYMRGYLGFFSARTDWFDPSLLQIISFSAYGICIAFLLALLHHFLTERAKDADPFLWWMLYLIWVSAIVCAYLIYAVGCRRYHSSSFPEILGAVVLGTTFILSPVLLRAFAARHPIRREMRALEEESEAVKLATPSSEAERQNLMNRLDALVLRGEKLRQTLAENKAQWGWLWRYEGYVTLILIGYMIAYFSTVLGAMDAIIALGDSRAQAWVTAEESNAQYILFTDGTRTLVLDTVQGESRVVYQNPEASQSLHLMDRMKGLDMPILSNRKLGPPATLPSSTVPAN